MIDREGYVFLLGGRDLEMEEIGRILAAGGLQYHDLKLEWGAVLSAYQPFFDNRHTFVGIELVKDTEPPAKYLEIDHHNEKSNLPSSIEQLASLLGIALDHRQQLIAANDRGYIPAMLAMGATHEEVDEIRADDRRAQGVTELEELEAKVAIANGVQIGDLLVVYYTADHFAPVTDRTNSPQLIVWNKKTLNYYGYQAALVTEYFQQLIAMGKAYFGGNPLSFFGLVENKTIGQETELIKDEIIKLTKNPS